MSHEWVELHHIYSCIWHRITEAVSVVLGSVTEICLSVATASSVIAGVDMSLVHIYVFKWVNMLLVSLSEKSTGWQLWTTGWGTMRVYLDVVDCSYLMLVAHSWQQLHNDYVMKKTSGYHTRHVISMSPFDVKTSVYKCVKCNCLNINQRWLPWQRRCNSSCYINVSCHKRKKVMFGACARQSGLWWLVTVESESIVKIRQSSNLVR